MDQWLEEIRAALPELVVYQQEPMKKHTTFRVGGPADLYVCPKKQELPVILGLVKKKGLAVTVIGNGSNLLVGDKGIRGLVIEAGADCAILSHSPPPLCALPSAENQQWIPDGSIPSAGTDWKQRRLGAAGPGRDPGVRGK